MSDASSSRDYVITSQGTMTGAYCKAGLTMNSRMVNVLGFDGKPLPCSGSLTLTDNEFMEYTKERK